MNQSIGQDGNVNFFLKPYEPSFLFETWFSRYLPEMLSSMDGFGIAKLISKEDYGAIMDDYYAKAAALPENSVRETLLKMTWIEARGPNGLLTKSISIRGPVGLSLTLTVKR